MQGHERLFLLLLPPSTRAGGPSRERVASALTAIGLLAASWDRLANVPVAGSNVRISILLFGVAAVLVFDRGARRVGRTLRSPGRRQLVASAFTAVIVLHLVRAIVPPGLGASAGEVAAVLGGAVLPAVALFGVLATPSDMAWALRWFIVGAAIAAAFGLYQLLAFYTGLPQGIAYTGTGTSGSGGRIAAFSYEPAYFASFLVLALGAAITLSRLERREMRWPTLFVFGLVLTLVNARSLLFVLPVVALLLAFAWRRNRRLLLRAVVAGAAGGFLAFALPLGAAAVVGTWSPPPPTATAAERDAADNGPTTPDLPTDVLDPNEPSSNGPRLGLYRAVLQVDLAHLLLGVGPGSLGDALTEIGYSSPNQGARVVANNIWLQAGADGGAPLILLELAALVAVVLLWVQRRQSPEQAMLSTWLAVVLVGGMLTSSFFDTKLWVVLALAVVLSGASPQEGTADA